jgi:hypothetical protein
MLVLDPGRAAPASEVRRVETLEEDALEAVRPRYRYELGRLVDEVRRDDPAAPAEVEFVQ